MKRHLAYLRSVLTHKRFVFRACRWFGVPLWSALIHDWDKFTPKMWFPYAQTFYNADGTKAKYNETPEFAKAWMGHQRRPHHWQAYLLLDGVPIEQTNMLVWDRGDVSEIVEQDGRLRVLLLTDVEITARKMSDRFINEMIADWYGAGRAYDANWTPLEPRKWYEARRGIMTLHPETRKKVETRLKEQEDSYLLADRHQQLGILQGKNPYLF